ncbi:hypothetical protein [Streptomyces sp. NPDC050485]|uniref:hypothetical protein n=1 Tax=Streptomyces sp. NPDC050485 TaxID=3365617 RepID=UPI0037B76E84
MTTQWNPSAYQGQRIPAGQWIPADARDEWWWVVPSLATGLMFLFGWLDLSVLSGFGSRSGSTALTVALYAVPSALIAASWLLPHRRTLRPARIGLGVGGAMLAFVLTKISAMAILIVFLCVALMFGWNLHD